MVTEHRIDPKGIKPGANGYLLTTLNGVPVWSALSAVVSIAAGTGIGVDSSDPAHPVVSVSNPIPAGGTSPNVLTQLSGGTLTWMGNVVVLIPHGGTVPVGTPIGAIIVEKA